MICHALMRLQSSNNLPIPKPYQWHRDFHPSSFSDRALFLGSLVPEPRVRPECQIVDALDLIHSGKDASIAHMLQGGDGFPDHRFETPFAQGAFDCGASAERHDISTMREWARSLNKAINDRRAGVRG